MNDILYYDPEIRDVRKRIPYKPASPIYKLIIDRNGTLWAGLNKSAIFSYGPATERSETVYLLQNEYNIEDICLGDNGDIWLAMLGGGVCNYNPSTGKKTFYTTANGWPTMLHTVF
jgi:streptogramin lyase